MITVTQTDVELVFDILNLLVFAPEGFKVPIPDHLDVSLLNGYLGYVIKVKVGDKEYTTCILNTEYHSWDEFVEIVAHEMIHLYQVIVLGAYGDHDEFFWSMKPIFEKYGIPLREGDI